MSKTEKLILFASFLVTGALALSVKHNSDSTDEFAHAPSNLNQNGSNAPSLTDNDLERAPTAGANMRDHVDHPDFMLDAKMLDSKASIPIQHPSISSSDGVFIGTHSNQSSLSQGRRKSGKPIEPSITVEQK